MEIMRVSHPYFMYNILYLSIALTYVHFYYCRRRYFMLIVYVLIQVIQLRWHQIPVHLRYRDFLRIHQSYYHLY